MTLFNVNYGMAIQYIYSSYYIIKYIENNKYMYAQTNQFLTRTYIILDNKYWYCLICDINY